MGRYRRLITAIIILLIGCTSTRTREFFDSDLLMDIAYPENWEIDESGTIDFENEGQISGAYISFYATGTPLFIKSGQRVYRYSSSLTATWHYNRMLPLWRDATARATAGKTPEGFNYSSSLADQWYFGCLTSISPFDPELFGRESIICVLLARYEEFIVRFVAPLQVDDQSYLSLAEVEGIVKAIDARMGNYLQPER